MSSAVTLPIKFLADDAPTVVATVGTTERRLQLDIVCSNVLVHCVDDAKCPKHCDGDVENIKYSSYHKIDYVCMMPVNTTVSVKGFMTPRNFRVGQVGVTDDDDWQIPTRADGVFGLGPTSRSSSYSDKFRLSGSTDDSMLSAQLSSFSLSFGATPADGGSLILNGADDDRITKEKLTGHTVQLQRGEGHDLDFRNILWDGVAVQSFDTNPFELDTTVDKVELPSVVWGKIWDKLSGVSCKSTYLDSKTEYSCDANAKLPPLGLTFGDSTFYLTKEQYTAPHPKQTDRVLLKLASSFKVYRLGLPFLRAFPVQITPGRSVTVYCKDGKSCAKGVTPKEMPTSRPPRSSILDGGIKRPSIDELSDDSSFASTMHDFGVGYAIVSAIVLVMLIIAAIVRKKKNAKNTVDRESSDAVPVVELTPGAASAEYVDAKTPKA